MTNYDFTKFGRIYDGLAKSYYVADTSEGTINELVERLDSLLESLQGITIDRISALIDMLAQFRGDEKTSSGVAELVNSLLIVSGNRDILDILQGTLERIQEREE